MDEADYYALLKLSPTATQDEIRDSLTREQRHWSRRASNAPRQEDRQDAERQVTLLARARKTLLEPAARAAYDRARTGQPAPRQPEPMPSRPVSPPGPVAPPLRVSPQEVQFQQQQQQRAPAPAGGAEVSRWTRHRRRIGVAVLIVLVVGAAASNSNKTKSHNGPKPLRPAVKSAFLDALKPTGRRPAGMGATTVAGVLVSHALVYDGEGGMPPTVWHLRRAYRHFSAVVAVGDCQLSCTNPADTQTRFDVLMGGRTVSSVEVSNGQTARLSAQLPRRPVLELRMRYTAAFPGSVKWFWEEPKLSP